MHFLFEKQALRGSLKVNGIQNYLKGCNVKKNTDLKKCYCRTLIIYFIES